MAGAYILSLTAEDVRTIAFVGGRYQWSDWAGRLQEGENHLSESEAWEFNDAIVEDTAGDHSPFPMLDPHSALYEKLVEFVNSIV